MTKRQLYKNLTNLSQEKLNAINNKKNYVRNDVMKTVNQTMQRRKNKRYRTIDGSRKKLMIPDPKCPEFEAKSKIEKIFKKIFLSKNILLTFLKLILVFINIKKKITS